MKQETSLTGDPVFNSLTKVPIAIIGLSSLLPQAKNLQQFWNNILSKLDCITDVPPTRWHIDDYYDPDATKEDKTYCKRGGFLPDIDFDPSEFGIPPSILEVTDVSQLLSLLVAKEAFRDAGLLGSAKFDFSRTGVILGVTGAQKLLYQLVARLQYPVLKKIMRNCGLSDKTADEIVEKMKLAYVKWQEDSFPGYLGNVIAGRIANRFNLGGMNCTVDAACASSLAALKLALSELIEGRSDVMLTGGVDTDNSPVMYMCFSKTPAFSRKSHISPFDETSDGMMVGEGIVMLVLKRLADAERDQDRIYAVIKGIGSSSDGRNKSIYAPAAEGQARALMRAYEDAGISPATIGLIEAHGTGTVSGDPCEIDGLLKVFTPDVAASQSVALGTVKSQIGHTKGAAGAAGLVKAALALHQKVLPPTLHVEKPQPKLASRKSPLYVNTEARPWFRTNSQVPRRAGVSSFGFGGTNFHVVLEEYEAEHSESYRLHGGGYPIFLYGPTREALLAQLKDLSKKIHSHGGIDLEDIIDESGSPMSRDAVRVGFVVSGPEDAQRLLKRCEDLLSREDNGVYWDDKEGIYFRRASLREDMKIVALFSGQGSQCLNMGRELALCYPEMRNAFGEVDKLFTNDGLPPLSRTIFPPPFFDRNEQAAHDETVKSTECAQPALAAFCTGLYEIMTKAGFVPDMVAGHSFGELSALWAAGAYRTQDYFFLARSRGKAMANSAADSMNGGGMLAIEGAVDSLLEELVGYENVTVSNINSNRQIVISGKLPALISIRELLKSRGCLATLLPVSAAFHSPMMNAAKLHFEKAIAQVHFQTLHMPVYSNTTGLPYSSSIEDIRDTLNRHMLSPVLFKSQVENLYNAGGCVFVEIGPKMVLTNLVKDILQSKPHLAVALSPSPARDAYTQLLKAVTQLKVAGVPLGHIDPYWKAVHKASRPKSTSTVSLSGGYYISDKTRNAFESTFAESLQKKGTPDSDLRSSVSEFLRHELKALRTQEKLLRQQLESVELFHTSLEKTAAMRGDDLVDVADTVEADSEKRFPSETDVPVSSQKPLPVLEGSEEDISKLLISIVSDKTGYPVETLELRMDMESDLGIDSIKKVEILAALQDSVRNLKKLNPQELGPLRTLAEVTHYIHRKVLERDKETKSDEADIRPYARDAAPDLRRVAEIRRREVRLKLLPAPDALEVQVPRNHVCVITNDGTPITPRLASAMRSKGWKVVILNFSEWQKTSDVILSQEIHQIDLKRLDENSVVKLFEGITGQMGPIGAFIHLSPFKSHPEKENVPSYTTARSLLKSIFMIARHLGKSLCEASAFGRSYFIAVTRLDGELGLGRKGWFSALEGGLYGLTKTLAAEWNSVCCRVIDLSPALAEEQAVGCILAELLDPDRSVTEVGHTPEGRRTLTTELCSLKSDGIREDSIDESTVFLVTGGARGITAECVRKLAERYKCRFILIGRTPIEGREPAWAEGCQDEYQLKKNIMNHLATETGASSPKHIEELFRLISARRTVQRTLKHLNDLGSLSEYLAMDVTSEASLLRARLEKITQRLGPIKGIIHAAGQHSDNLVENKTVEEFESVFSPKVDGFENILKCVPMNQVEFLVFFSSVSAFYGNKGQSDYAAANEVLNKWAYQLKAAYPLARVISFNWAPWKGGMVTPELQKRFEDRGIQTISMADGAKLFLDELTTEQESGVQVLLSGSFEASATDADAPLRIFHMKRTLMLHANPFLMDHVILGHPVLPAACAMTWLIDACRRLHPGYPLCTLYDFKILKGIVFDDWQPIELCVEVKEIEKSPARILFAADISRNLDLGIERIQHHYSSSITLGKLAPNVAEKHLLVTDRENPLRGDSLYERGDLFHGPCFRGIKKLLGRGQHGLDMECILDPLSDQLQGQFSSPLNPFVIDVQLQSLLVWTTLYLHHRCLPVSINRFDCFKPLDFGDKFYVSLVVTSSSESAIRGNIITFDENGHICYQMTGVETVTTKNLDQDISKTRQPTQFYEKSGESGKKAEGT